MLEKNENAENRKDNIATTPKEEADAEKESEISANGLVEADAEKELEINAKGLVEAVWSTGDISEYWEYIYIYV